jgi:hypothetical protein
MNTRIKRVLALTGGTLMVASMAATPAMAQDGDDYRNGGRDGGRDRGDRRCSIELDQNRRTLDVELDLTRRAGGQRALVQADFDTRRGGVDREVVTLDSRGDADLDFRIPRGADDVTVTVWTRGGREVISCDEDLDLNRRGR